MRSESKTLDNQVFVPLRDAVLCLECSFISSGLEGTCCVCHGDALLSLAEVLPVRLAKLSARKGSGETFASSEIASSKAN